jgi:hypothetical protein
VRCFKAWRGWREGYASSDDEGAVERICTFLEVRKNHGPHRGLLTALEAALGEHASGQARRACLRFVLLAGNVREGNYSPSCSLSENFTTC